MSWLPHSRPDLFDIIHAAAWGAGAGWPDVNGYWTRNGANSLGFYAGTWTHLCGGTVLCIRCAVYWAAA